MALPNSGDIPQEEHGADVRQLAGGRLESLETEAQRDVIGRGMNQLLAVFLGQRA